MRDVVHIITTRFICRFGGLALIPLASRIVSA